MFQRTLEHVQGTFFDTGLAVAAMYPAQGRRARFNHRRGAEGERLHDVRRAGAYRRVHDDTSPGKATAW